MKVLVLLSGGRDSVCLLHRMLSEDVAALHVNYGLRGEESDGDEGHTHPQVSRGLPAGNTRQFRWASQSSGTLPSGPGTGCDSGWQAGGASSGPFDIRDVR